MVPVLLYARLSSQVARTDTRTRAAIAAVEASWPDLGVSRSTASAAS
jgi:hypothetical protein